MAELSLRVTRKNPTFFSRKQSVTIDAQFSESALPLAHFLEALCQNSPNILPELEPESEINSVEDLRGRPPETFLSKDLPNPPSTGEEEFFYGDGVVIEADGPEAESYSEQLPSTPFTVRLGSKFEAFKGSAHILHRATRSNSPLLDEMKPELTIRVLARMFPARLERVRLGFESYEPVSGNSIFGTVPTVSSKLYLELTQKRLSIQANCDFQGKALKLPFEDRGLFPLIDSALRAAGICPNFRERVDAELSR